MMESIRVRQRVGQDGILHLAIPVGLKNLDIEVMVIYQPAQSDMTVGLSLEDFYGVCEDDSINIDDEGISDVLDEDLAGVFE